MTVVVAVFAVAVAMLYLLIALDVVPRLVALAESPSVSLRAARWGACAFFAGCAATHLVIAAHSLTSPQPPSALHQLADHLLPHLAQLAGGLTFVVVAKRHIDIRVTSKDVAARLEEAESRFRASFEHAPLGIVLVSLRADTRGRLIQVNEALCAMLGYPPDELQGRLYLDLTAPNAVKDRDQPDVRAGVRDQLDLEQALLHADGRELWVHVRSSLVLDDAGSPLFNLLQLRDVSEERRHRAQLRYLADHDSLTGLFNRRRFEEELHRVVAVSCRYGQPASLLLVDLDQFKHINDTFGHLTGDELLRKVGEVLATRLREADVVGRLGGDEFGVICPQTGRAAAATLARELIGAIRQEARLEGGGRTIGITASIGVRSVSAGQTVRAEQLLRDADIAMYDAKERGRNRVSTSSDDRALPAVLRNRWTWSERVREALESGGFVLYEQPIVDLADGSRQRSELLVRMKSDRGQPVPPGVFLPVAERFGQIQAIDRWVVRTGIDLLATRLVTNPDAVVEINLSAASIGDEVLVEELLAYLVEAPVDPTRLVLELTEAATGTCFERALSAVNRFRALGCRFALDGFGSGSGSFGFLKHLPVDCVKIGGDFVRDLPTSPADQLVVRAIAQLCDGLGKEMVAEFVQDEATLDLLRRIGVRYVQGHHVGEPRPVHELA